jgi:hypothetical protein
MCSRLLPAVDKIDGCMVDAWFQGLGRKQNWFDRYAKTTAFFKVPPCNLVYIFQSFEVILCLLPYLENRDCCFFRNVGTILPNYRSEAPNILMSLSCLPSCKTSSKFRFQHSARHMQVSSSENRFV